MKPKKKGGSSAGGMTAGGCASIVVLGAVVSRMYVHDQLSGVASTFPEMSTARTASVCEPGLTAKSEGTGHAVKVAAPSSLHWKVAAGSSLESANDATGLYVVAAGPKRIWVSGGSRSTTMNWRSVASASGNSSGT